MPEGGVRRLTGRLVLNPTDFNLPYPYGGTELGLTRNGLLQFNQTVHYERAEEYGNQPIAVIQSDAEPMYVATISEWSNTGPVASLPGTVIGGLARRSATTFQQNATTRAGLESPLSGVLLVAPESPQDQALLLYNAMPHYQENASAAWTDAQEWGIPVVWVGGLDVQGRSWMLAPIRELQL